MADVVHELSCSGCGRQMSGDRIACPHCATLVRLPDATEPRPIAVGLTATLPPDPARQRPLAADDTRRRTPASMRLPQRQSTSRPAASLYGAGLRRRPLWSSLAIGFAVCMLTCAAFVAGYLLIRLALAR